MLHVLDSLEPPEDEKQNHHNWTPANQVDKHDNYTRKDATTNTHTSLKDLCNVLINLVSNTHLDRILVLIHNTVSHYSSCFFIFITGFLGHNLCRFHSFYK